MESKNKNKHKVLQLAYPITKIIRWLINLPI